MAEASSFAFHVTYTCPLTCAHCCFSSSPTVKDKLDFDLMVRTIEAIPQSFSLVAFTGGEPFLLGPKLADLVGLASRRGFRTRIVTSAYFGKTEALARRRLQPMRDAGLIELSISWDDFHEPFVSVDCVRNTFWTAVDLGILPAVNIVEGQDCRWTKPAVMDALGLPASFKHLITESPLNETGRAELELQGRKLVNPQGLGPCPYVITGPTASAKGKLLACCGVLPEMDGLVLQEQLDPEDLESAIERSKSDAVLNWLHLRGPFNLLEQASVHLGRPAPAAETVGGNCEACRMIFADPEVRGVLPALMAADGGRVLADAGLLDAMGLVEPDMPMRLSAGRSRQPEPA